MLNIKGIAQGVLKISHFYNFSGESLWGKSLAGQACGTGFIWIVFSLSVYLPSFIEFLSEMLKLWQIENFAIGNFLVGRVGRLKNGWIVIKRYSRIWMRERNLHTKFQLNRPNIAEVILCFHFWLVGWLGRSACMDFDKTSWSKAAYHKVLPWKYQGDSSRRSPDIPFLKVA